MMKKNKHTVLYIYNSDSLLKIAEAEGINWLNLQKEEFDKIIPNKGSFARALKEYNNSKHSIPDDICIAYIEGKNKYHVYASGVID